MLLRRYHKKSESEQKSEEVADNEIEKIQEDNEVNISELKVDKLREMAKERNIEGYSKMKKDELIAALAGD